MSPSLIEQPGFGHGTKRSSKPLKKEKRMKKKKKNKRGKVLSCRFLTTCWSVSNWYDKSMWTDALASTTQIYGFFLSNGKIIICGCLYNAEKKIITFKRTMLKVQICAQFERKIILFYFPTIISCFLVTSSVLVMFQTSVMVRCSYDLILLSAALGFTISLLHF